MKKLVVILSCFALCLSVFSSCNTKELPKEEFPVSVEETMAELAQFFVEENFVPGLSEWDMRSAIDQYSYQGKKISESVSGYYSCGDGVACLDANGDLFGYSNRYIRSQDTNVVDYTNLFYSKVPLDGLTLPLEIAFGDSLETVCKKMGLSEDCREGLVSGEKKSLYQNGQVTVTLLYDEAAKESSSVYSYVLEYQKVYESTRASGTPVTVTETMKFSFEGEGDPLAYFYVEVYENYKH